MFDSHQILGEEQLRQFYGDFYLASPKKSLDRVNVPEKIWPLLPYAEFWGLTDESARDRLLRTAPGAVIANLKRAVASFEDALEDWLAGPEADSQEPTDEYVAFSALVMAADAA